MTEINHRTVSNGGVFDFPGKPTGYEVEPQQISRAEVNPRIDLYPKNENRYGYAERELAWFYQPVYL